MVTPIQELARLMKTPLRKLFLPIGLLLLSLVLAETTARAVVDFKEITAVSVAIKAIYLEGQDNFYFPPGTDGQLVAETCPAQLDQKVRWTIVDQSGDIAVDLDPASGLLVVAETSGVRSPPKGRTDPQSPCPEHLLRFQQTEFTNKTRL